MEQRVSAITFGVEDLDLARKFYEEGLGWTRSAGQDGVIAFYQMNGFVFGLYSAQALADEASKGERGTGFGGIALAYNTRFREEVDQVLAQVEAAGGTIVKPAEDVFWGGYSGYFADPDGHRWEVAHNDGWPISEDGQTRLK